ncbi:MAG TPA: VOC family protein [Alphaproteobacteria bacterium]|jgi:predicted enzyme related to lactoylglutathione lyase
MARIVDSRLVLTVRNLAESTQFYVDVLGFTLHLVDGAGWCFLSRDSLTVMLGECPDERPASELGDHSYVGYLVVEGVDELHQQIISSGAQVTEPEAKPWGFREFGLRTPDGHRFTFGERIKRA